MEEKITYNQETGQIYWSLETQRAGCGKPLERTER